MLFLVALAAKFWMEPKGYRLRSLIWKLVLVAIILFLLFFSYGSLRGMEPGVSLIVLLTSVKILEAHTAREFHIMKVDEFSSLGTPNHAATARFIGQNEIVETISVKTETLADAYARLKARWSFTKPFLKVDTQGFDVEVVRSGGAMLGAFVGLQSELAIKPLYRESIDFREAISIYRELGFELSAIVPNNAGHFPLLMECDCIMINSALNAVMAALGG